MAADPLSEIRERTEANRFWRTLGVTVEDARPGWVRLRLPLRDDLRNAPGAPVHGGVLSALVDMAVGGALATLHEASAGGVGQATLDLNVSFVGGARGDTLFAEGRIVKHGRTIAFGETSITDGTGALVALGRATYLILQRSAP